MEEEMANRSAAGSRLIDRRTVLQVAAALAAAGPALMREGHAAARPPVVIDAQVHAYAANTPERPWHSVPNWPAHVTGDEMVAAMDKVGVDGAIYISPFSMPGSFAHAATGSIEIAVASLGAKNSRHCGGCLASARKRPHLRSIVTKTQPLHHPNWPSENYNGWVWFGGRPRRRGGGGVAAAAG
jgi:hypothetical protein